MTRPAATTSRRRLIAALGLAVAPAVALPSPAGAEESRYVAVVAPPGGGLAVHPLEVASAAAAARVGGRLGRLVAVGIDEPLHALEATDATEMPGDPYRRQQWALDRTAFEASWSRAAGPATTVAVIDTGVDASHEELKGSVLSGWDAISGQEGATSDDHGHGTHVAGIIAAQAGNRRGGAGAAPGVRVLPVRVLDAEGNGWLSDVLEGIVWAVDHGADVVNLSLGGTTNPESFRPAIRYAIERGVVVVAAAGNEALEGNPVSYPAADPDVVAVAAVRPDGARASFSSHGSYVDLAAPGYDIFAPCPQRASTCAESRDAGWTAPAGYGRLSGTSMAAPFVSAAAALVLRARPELSAEEVRRALEGGAEDLGSPGRDPEFGAGLVDPVAALRWLEADRSRAPSSPVPGPSASPEPVTSPDEPTPLSPPPSPAVASGYWVVGRRGAVAAFGSAPSLGDPGDRPLGAPIVAAAATPGGGGYWLTGADGAVFAFGDAPELGSMAGKRQNAPVVGMAATPSGKGYWLLGADGGVFSYGDAAFFGSTGGIRLNRPVVDMTPTRSGRGYWLVASDGGVFSYGDAGFFGSTGGLRLNRPITSLAASERGGYWLVASDGGIFAFGVPFHGSLPGLGGAGQTETGLPEGRRIRATGGGAGYYILGSDGRVFAFGAAVRHGSAEGIEAVDLLLAEDQATGAQAQAGACRCRET